MSPPYATLPVLSSTQPTDESLEFSWDMVVVHNVYIRGINSMYAKATVLQEADVPAFIGYCMSGIASITRHHKLEEAHIFPFLSKQLSMTENLEQHQALESGLAALGAYLLQVQDGVEKYDGEEIRSLLLTFSDVFYQHLQDEAS